MQCGKISTHLIYFQSKIMPDTEITLAVISEKIDNLTDKVCQNQKEINDLKEQVNMGRGAVKVIFVLGAVVSAVYTGIRMLMS
jgi:hypothetical protein